MNPFLVRCQGCTRTWHSRTMADGLRAIGNCPRCGGTLEWADDEPGAAPAAPGEVTAQPDGTGGVAPYLVMGLPRREF